VTDAPTERDCSRCRKRPRCLPHGWCAKCRYARRLERRAGAPPLVRARKEEEPPLVAEGLRRTLYEFWRGEA
jgi:hypothetical protein